MRRLRAELKAAQEALLASRHAHDALIQDLRAANEELQSINEEYRSTAEELETSKEELQSINEELHTVNAELKSKLESISVAHSDLQNLTAATEIGTLFLDPELRIKMFTAPIAELFSVTKNDVGRVITDFTHRLDYDGLAEDVRRVLRDLAPIEREVRGRDNRWYVIAVAAVPHGRGPDRRHRGDLRRHHRAAAGRAGAEPFGAAAPRARAGELAGAVSHEPRLGRDARTRGRRVPSRHPIAPTRIWLDPLHSRRGSAKGPRGDPGGDRDEDPSSTWSTRCAGSDGSLGWTLSRAIPVLDDDGNIVEWFGSASDVTARRRAEDAFARERGAACAC